MQQIARLVPETRNLRWKLDLPDNRLCLSIFAPLGDKHRAAARELSFDEESGMVSKHHKILQRILNGTSDVNISFQDLRHLLFDLGFTERINGSHHIFVKDIVEEILNLQAKGGKAKPYQVKQVRSIIIRYKLAGSVQDEQV